MSRSLTCQEEQDALSLLKALVVNADGTPWVDCENTSQGAEAIIKQTLYEDDTGNVYINFVE